VLTLLVRITAACRRPNDIASEESVAAYTASMAEMMVEFPVDILEASASRWVDEVAWWPKRAELRAICMDELRVRSALCEELQAQIAACEAQKPGARGVAPRGVTAAFVEEVRRRHGDAYVRGYLSGGVNCLFSDTTVFVPSRTVQQILLDENYVAVGRTKVQIEICRTIMAMLERHCESAGPAPERKPSSRRA